MLPRRKWIEEEHEQAWSLCLSRAYLVVCCTWGMRLCIYEWKCAPQRDRVEKRPQEDSYVTRASINSSSRSFVKHLQLRFCWDKMGFFTFHSQQSRALTTASLYVTAQWTWHDKSSILLKNMTAQSVMQANAVDEAGDVKVMAFPALIRWYEITQQSADASLYFHSSIK